VSEITIYTNIAKATQTMTAEIEVEISIEPCSITSLVNTTPFSDVTYQLGTSGFTFGDYIYD
jgi:hypothetical protein